MFEALAALIRQQWDNQVFAGGLALGALGAVGAFGVGRLPSSRFAPVSVIGHRPPLTAVPRRPGLVARSSLHKLVPDTRDRFDSLRDDG